jgi:multimeric flavodoxin WrbA
LSCNKVVILDGRGHSGGDLDPALRELSAALAGEGAQIETFPLREMKLAHCLGCFGCWLKTPGMCVENDAGRAIARAIVRSDVTALFTPVTFGGYSPELKRMVDRFIQLASPFFTMDHGEVHHPPRYPRRPRLMMVGVQRRPNDHEARIFKTLAGRNAINFHPPSYAAEVVGADEPAAALREKFEDLLTRRDALPFGNAAATLMPPAVSAMPAAPNGKKRALLIVGSPKVASSASKVLGSYLLERLGASGWETESVTLRAGLHRPDGADSLVDSARRSGLILLVFPLYVDSLPHLVTKALQSIAEARQAVPTPAPQRLLALVNSGFPEPHQNAVALAICREFAEQAGMVWSGGLALGGGGFVGDEPLTAPGRSGPPLKRLIRALDITAAALDQGRPAPEEAYRLIAMSPIPFVPAALWKRLYVWIGGWGLAKQAALNGVPKGKMLAQPYAL